MSHPRYATEEIVRRGKALYESAIRPNVEGGNRGRYLVLDIETGDYEIDDDQLAAAERAQAKRPDAPLFAVRIGYPTLGRIGSFREVRSLGCRCSTAAA
jgi:hypothetical protein